MSKPTILIQLDVDPKPSAFDAVVAIDAGIDRLLTYGGVEPKDVRDLVHGAIFTRGSDDLKRTAIFIGGSDAARAEAVRDEVHKTFFGPFRVSTLLDANGCNTTAVSAILAAIEACEARQTSLDRIRAAVLGATGPVGRRASRLLARLGAGVVVASRSFDRARSVAEEIEAQTGRTVDSAATGDEEQIRAVLRDVQIVVAAGAAGATLLPRAARSALPPFLALIDLNAVPPLGIEGVEAIDRRKEIDGGTLVWGALGVGAAKMKIHKKALRELFAANDRRLDAEEILELARTN